MHEEPAPSARPGDQEIRDALVKLLASKRFVRAERHSRFLRYVVEETLEGRGGQLKESLLGAEVFGRPVDYDPRVDPVVRVEATKLRARLEEYYSGDGSEDAIVIDFPRGGYVPHFRAKVEAVSSEAEAEATSLPAEAPPVADWSRRRYWILAGMAALVAVFAGLLLFPRMSGQPVVAVLPFEDIGPEFGGGACEALAAELRTRLAKSGIVRVVSTASSRAAAKSKPSDARSLGRELQADVLVEGTVRRHEGKMAVMLQLIDAESGLSFWTGRYECDPAMWDESILDRIAREVRAALQEKRRA